MPATTVAIAQRKLRELCKRHRIRRLAWLPASPMSRRRGRREILVEFEPRASIGLLELVGAERELSELLQRKVLLITPGLFHDGMRKDTRSEAREIFPAAG